MAQIAAGAEHGLALTATGQLYSFGDNDFGELGTTTNAGTSNPNPTPAVVSLPGATGRVSAIAAGGWFSLALTQAGQLYAFGDNYAGQLGSPTNAGTNNPNPTPAVVAFPGSAAPVIAIAAGVGHSLALTATGQVYAFGDNSDGQLGNPTDAGAPAANPAPVLVALPAGTTVDTVGSGSYASQSFVVVADLAVITSRAAQGQVRVPFRAQVRATGGAEPYRWTATGLPPGLSIEASTGLVSGEPTAPGRFSAAVTVTDSFGITASAPLEMLISAAPKAPALSALDVSPRSSATRGRLVGGKCIGATALDAGRPACRLALALRITYGLSVPARVSFTVARQLVGELVGGRCVAPTGAKTSEQACVRLVVVPGSIQRSSTAGTNIFTWSGRLAGGVLGPGSYELRATASANGLAGESKTVFFRLTV